MVTKIQEGKAPIYPTRGEGYPTEFVTLMTLSYEPKVCQPIGHGACVEPEHPSHQGAKFGSKSQLTAHHGFPTQLDTNWDFLSHGSSSVTDQSQFGHMSAFSTKNVAKWPKKWHKMVQSDHKMSGWKDPSCNITIFRCTCFGKVNCDKKSSKKAPNYPTH